MSRYDSFDQLPDHIKKLNKDLTVSVSAAGPAKSPAVGKIPPAPADDNGRAFLGTLPAAVAAAAVLEFRFDRSRRWRFDVAWPDRKIAFEIEGGIWMKTAGGRSAGHAHPDRFLKDIEKYNMAAVLGWRVFRITPDMIADRRGLYWVLRAFEGV